MMLDFDNACASATILRMRYPSAATQRENGRSLHGFFRCLVDWLSFPYRFGAQVQEARFGQLPYHIADTSSEAREGYLKRYTIVVSVSAGSGVGSP